MAVMMAVVMVTAQKERGHQIDNESDTGDRQCVAIIDNWAEDQILYAFECHPDRDEGQQDAAGIPGERIDLAGAEAEGIVAGAGSRVPVGDERQAQRTDMRAHVPTVGLERDRARPPADDELADHRHGRDPHDPAGSSLPDAVVIVLVLVMDVLGQIVRLHAACSLALSSRRSQAPRHDGGPSAARRRHCIRAAPVCVATAWRHARIEHRARRPRARRDQDLDLRDRPARPTMHPDARRS